MSIQEERRALAEVKAQNDRIIAEIKGKLERAIAIEKKIKKFDYSREQALLDTFSNRAELVRSFVTTGGEGYFTARLENEKAFTAFATEYMGFVDKLSAALEGKRPDLAKRDVAIEVLETRHDAWHETKNSNWKVGIGEMNETKLKSSLLDMIERTTEDLERFAKKAVTLDGENTTVALSLAPDIIDVLDKFKEKLIAGYIADTENNFKYVENIRAIIAGIRGSITGRTARNKINNALEELEREFGKFEKCETTGKQIDKKKVIEPFSAGTAGAVKEGKADELASAVFVLTNLNVNEEFFATAMEEAIAKFSVGVGYNAEEDPFYIKMKAQAGVFADQIRKEKASPRPNLVSIKAAMDNVKLILAKAEKYRGDKEKEAQAKLTSSLGALREQEIVSNFQEVASLFTSRANVPYSVRAQTMEQNGLSDLGDLYQQYLTAAYVGDKETMVGIKALLDATKEILNPESVIENVATELDGIFDIDSDTDTVVDAQAELAAQIEDFDMSILAGLGTEIDTPVTESGETTKVNVGEEPVKEAEADNRMSSLMSEFMI